VNVTVRLTGSSTLGTLAPLVRHELARHGFEPTVPVGDPGAFALELAAPQPADLTLCLLDASVVFDRLGDTPWTVDDVEAAATDVLRLVDGLARRHPGPLLLTTAPLWTRWSAQVLDLRERARLGVVWRRFTAGLLELGTGALPTVVVTDVEQLAAETGPARDPRRESYAHVAYTDALLGGLARQVGHLVRALKGRPRKALVLDLDGTMWAGTLAETGPDGLDMAHGFRGEAHRTFQRAVAQLGSQGVLLAVCSKNDPAEVAAVLADHPDLLVKASDLTAVVADWAPKAETVGRVAELIGIGTDSLVFVDDNATEAGLVRTHRPEIAMIEVDAADPARHLHLLLADGWFDATAITDEDRARAGRYRTEAKRTEFREGFGSLEDYLAELDTRLDLFAPRDADVPRLAQITQRTNQFSLTTRRLDESAVRAALADPAVVVAPVRVADRFGDHGVVGLALGRWTAGDLVLEDLAMSCRVLGRGVETAWLGELLRWAAAQGAHGVVGLYRPTERNGRVRDLYPDHGFAPAGEADGTHRFRHDLTAPPAPAPHVTVRSELPTGAPA
jgi:FkbH-like protein